MSELKEFAEAMLDQISVETNEENVAKVPVKFTYQPLIGGEHQVLLAGDFNNWIKNEILMDEDKSIKKPDIEYKFKYLSYDIYYYNDIELYKTDFRSRYEILQKIDITSLEDGSIDFNVKKYYEIDEGTEIIIQKDNNREYKLKVTK